MVEISSYDVRDGTYRKLGAVKYGVSDLSFRNFSGCLKLHFVARGGAFVARRGAAPQVAAPEILDLVTPQQARTKVSTRVAGGLLASPVEVKGFLDGKAKLSKTLWEDDEAKTKVLPGDDKGKKEGGCISIKREPTDEEIKNSKDIKKRKTSNN
jgi:hypothetical protein